MTQVSYDSRAVVIDGRRTLVLSGAVHYVRSTPAMWPDLIRRSKAAGLNTLETYVFWNHHERTRGVFDFSGNLDLLRFCQAVQDEGMRLILRIGPYICAETNYGGLPAWLREIPGVQMRTNNAVFKEAMARWVGVLTNYLKPMFAPQGGPIVMTQFENEYNNVAKNYGDEGQKYLQWAVELGNSLQMGVPLIMCFGGVPGALETINAWYGHDEIDKHHAHHPEMPALWTELWPAWYLTWGSAKRIRTPQNVAYSVCRFFAAGGTGVNYYMWHGGTNFDRMTMYLQTTSYDFDAPLDEYGFPNVKYAHLKKMHDVFNDYADVLLQSEWAAPEQSGAAKAWRYAAGGRELIFITNDEKEQSAEAEVDGQRYELPPQSAQLISGGKVLFDSSQVDASAIPPRHVQPTGTTLEPWRAWREPLPGQWPAALQNATRSERPIEQLQLTHDQSDYCWYTTTIAGGRGELTLQGVADVAHVYVDGRRVATSHTPLEEDRGPLEGPGFTQQFTLDVPAGEHELSILCCALGLIKGDWMIGMANMANERKGLWGSATWQGRELTAWTLQPFLLGEKCRRFAEPGLAEPWEEKPSTESDAPTWWRTRFSKPDDATALALDLAGMTKGLAWLNGQCLGRYWLIEGRDNVHPVQKGIIFSTHVGEPSQRHYHVPADWLTATNHLVLLDELGGAPANVRLCRSVPMNHKGTKARRGEGANLQFFVSSS